MSIAHGWHCTDDHVESRYLFSYRASSLVSLPKVWRCWDMVRREVDLISSIVPNGEYGEWETFLESHWSHNLIIVNEYGDMFTLGYGSYKAIQCPCRDKPSATTHEQEEISDDDLALTGC